MKSDDYSWVTQEMFDAELREQVCQTGEDWMEIPGVYELVAEYLNNDVLAALERRRDNEEDAGEEDE